MAKYQFCTYFDSGYLFRGLALYNSLLVRGGDFTLWVLCMDQTTYDMLKKMNLKNLELIALEDFEDRELLAVKGTRKIFEYYWTCTASLPLFILKNHPEFTDVAYLDADMYFFSSPQPIYEELGNKSIMIISHRYSANLEYLEKESGTYNVGMLIFKNDDNGLACLKWWRTRCLEWCYAYYEDGKYGDQMYLNDWPQRFRGVHVLGHKGAGLAPWNIAKYEIKKVGDQILVDQEPLIFYHFHALAIYRDLTFKTHKLLYRIQRQQLELIYEPYLKALLRAIKQVRTVDPNFDYGMSAKPNLMNRVRSKLIYFKKALYD